MLLQVNKQKSRHYGENIFVPNFAELDLKNRNSVNRYTGRSLEYGRGARIIMLLMLLAFFPGSFIAGIAVGNSTVVPMTLFGAMVAWMFFMIGCMIREATTPESPSVDFVPKDDPRWGMLMLEFADDRELWERLNTDMRVIGRGLLFRSQRELSYQLIDIVSSFMTSRCTRESAAQARREIDAVYAEYDQRQAEKQAAQEVEQETREAERQRLFDMNIQMARQNVEFYELTGGMSAGVSS